MTSQEALEEIRDFRYGENKLLVCQTEMYDIIKKDLGRLEKLEKENKELKEEKHKFRELYEIEKHTNLILKLENEKLKKALEILKEEPYIVEFGLENFTYDKFDNTYYYEVETYSYDDLDFRNKIYVISKEKYDLLKEAFNNE